MKRQRQRQRQRDRESSGRPSSAHYISLSLSRQGIVGNWACQYLRRIAKGCCSGAAPRPTGCVGHCHCHCSPPLTPCPPPSPRAAPPRRPRCAPASAPPRPSASPRPAPRQSETSRARACCAPERPPATGPAVQDACRPLRGFPIDDTLRGMGGGRRRAGSPAHPPYAGRRGSGWPAWRLSAGCCTATAGGSAPEAT